MRQFMITSMAVLTILVLSAWSAEAASILDQRNRFTVSYGVYGGGFQALAIDISYDLNKTTYDAKMKAKPYGALGRLLPWAGEYHTVGTIKKRNLIPNVHDRISAWRDDKSHVILTYKNGVLQSKREIDDEQGKNSDKIIPVEKELSVNTIDLVTAITDMLVTATDAKRCNYSREVFDGRRRFRMTFKDEGVRAIAPSAVNSFAGESRLCRMELIPLKGFTGKPRGYYRIQEEARAKGELPVVWLAPAWENGPVIPVRMLVKSEYGTVLMHLKGIKK